MLVNAKKSGFKYHFYATFPDLAPASLNYNVNSRCSTQVTAVSGVTRVTCKHLKMRWINIKYTSRCMACWEHYTALKVCKCHILRQRSDA